MSSEYLIEVTTYNFKRLPTENTAYTSVQPVYESQKIVNHSNPSDRKWLSSHLFWAARNGREVRITPRTTLPVIPN